MQKIWNRPRRPSPVIFGMGLIFLLMGLTSPKIGASAPRVLTTNPAVADGYVSPELTEITVVFDQPMDTALYSYVTLGDGFPEVTDDPRWLDDYTCVLPVRLEAGQNYWLYLNSQSYQGFRNCAGEVADPFFWAFRTAIPEQQQKPSERQERLNQESLAELTEIMNTRYAYGDRLGLDWGQVIGAEAERFLQAPNDFVFFAGAVHVLRQAEDSHLSLQIEAQTLPSYRRIVKANYNLQAVFSQLDGFQQWSNYVASGELEDIGYLVIAGWVDEAYGALDALKQFRDKRALIIDVRANSGGNELIAQSVARCFTAQPVVYGHSLIFDEETNEFAKLGVRELLPSEDFVYPGPVFVLMGEQVMSSNEAFLLMMRAAGATLIGERSYGSSGNPAPFTLANGITVFAPQWQALDAAGNLIEGRGIEPDLTLAFPGEAFADDDPLWRGCVEVIGE